MYRFRGLDPVTNEWVYGTCIDQTKFSTRILSETKNVWAYVDAKTVGVERILENSAATKLYQGDILRYSFKYKDEPYNRYYRVKENSFKAWIEEIWRDYALDPDTLEPMRFHNTEYAGSIEDLVKCDARGTWKVVGNIWQNSELIKEDVCTPN